MNKTRQPVETVNFQLYFKVIIRQNYHQLTDDNFEIKSKIYSLNMFYSYFKNSLIIHEQNTKKIIAVKESLHVIKHT